MERAYFVDAENIGNAWVSEPLPFTREDEIFLIQTPTCQKVPKDYINSLSSAVTTITIEPEHNGADMLITGLIGAKRNEYQSFIIVSNDRGFTPFVKYFREVYHCDIQRYGISENRTTSWRKKQKVKHSSLPEEEKQVVLNIIALRLRKKKRHMRDSICLFFF
jgi:hypothetical protein